MSKYKIYRIDHYNPVLIGKRRRRLNVMVSALSFVFLLIFLLLHQLTEIALGTLYIIFMIVIWTFYLYFYVKLKAENKKIVTIGDIEFTQKGIVKHIGDSAAEFSYNSISKIELKKHIPAVSANDSISGFFSYILSIEFKDSHIENMVVSDTPSGKFHDMSITHTLKTLKKIAPAEINLE